jgi:hypothetical protein
MTGQLAKPAPRGTYRNVADSRMCGKKLERERVVQPLEAGKAENFRCAACHKQLNPLKP